ncbi:unnamed protein product [Prorocentrum cordatum]|uniref:Uncharacterized protein n=1 Tax=Prorocentrum cordatum TaxID=2364126 RepID=A0ABN9VPC2_9DINO|nr:unnamed protein product [Polarella glacialis]
MSQFILCFFMQGEVRVTRIDAAHPRARLAKASVQPVQPRSLSQPASGLLMLVARDRPPSPRPPSAAWGLRARTSFDMNGHILRQLLRRRSGEVRDAFSPERCERTACLALFKTILLLCQRP